MAQTTAPALAPSDPSQRTNALPSSSSISPLQVTSPSTIPPSLSSFVLAGPELTQWKRRHATVIAATSAATVGVIAGYPFDLVKTRLQTIRYPSFDACIREIYTHEGFFGFFRGIGPILITVSFLRSISFSVYNTAKTNVVDAIKSNSSLSIQWQSPSTGLIIAFMVSGASAGSVVASLNAPFEFIKVQPSIAPKAAEATAAAAARAASSPAATNVQTKPPHPSSVPRSPAVEPTPRRLTAFQWARKIVQMKGFLGLYSGYKYHLLRDMSGTAMYFFGYESLKLIMTPVGGTPGLHVYMLAGGISGTCSWIVLYPFDLVKSVMQREALQTVPKYSSAIEFIRRRFRSSGIRGFYHGIGAQLTRSFPVHSLNFLVYEEVLAWCKRA
ncbi:mitochondrial carrier domain-containing protein [Zopfochytrium polystomum]|nr:mitochondrial carrier domain-containing protein [Zopfochytrium polystomum]